MVNGAIKASLQDLPFLKSIARVFTIVVICVFSYACQQNPDQDRSTTTKVDFSSLESPDYYRNPVIPGFNPDPSITRVGDDFYLATSTFEYFPGVPIYHSKNLVNWKLIGHALHRPSQLNLKGVNSTAGIYAPTLRYHDGTFYMITTMVTGPRNGEPKGNFVVTAKNPAGPWSDPHWIDDAPGIDPSLFFDDDGRVYYSGNLKPEKELFSHHRIIWTQEIDIKTFKLKGPRWLLDAAPYKKTKEIGNVVAFEGPHLYKKDGAYYMLVSHGGTGMTHAVSIWRSDSVAGPWEINPANPILTHRGYARSGINATGHADLVQTPAGDWWTVFLGVRSYDRKNNPTGRETFLAPVDWSGKWPRVNPKGKEGRTAWRHEVPKLPKIKQNSLRFFDDFSSDTLRPHWTFVRTPSSKWWKLDKARDTLQIELREEKIAEFAHPSFTGIRINGPRTSISTEIDFNPVLEGEKAGLVVLRGHDPFWSLVKEKHGKHDVVSTYYKEDLIVRKKLLSKGVLRLNIVLADFKLFFSYQEEGKDWKEFAGADAAVIGFPAAGRFTGAFAGLYATTNKKGEAQRHASFHWFELTPVDQDLH